MQNQTSLNSVVLEQIVSKPAWKEILLELINAHEIDPWNVDLIEIADAFLKRVREMRSLDLLIPANVILATAILLRHKSDYLRFGEPTPPSMLYEDTIQLSGEEIPSLELASRIPPKRQITIQELMDEMERIIKYESSERLLKKQPKLEIVNLKLNGVDLEMKMEEMLNLVRSNIDDERWTMFSQLIKGKKNQEVIFCLLSLLHLAQKKMVGIHQDKLWDEIFIQLL